MIKNEPKLLSTINSEKQERERADEAGEKLHSAPLILSILLAVGIVSLPPLAGARQVVTGADVRGDVNKVQSPDKLSKLLKSARDSITGLLLLSCIWANSGWTKKAPLPLSVFAQRKSQLSAPLSVCHILPSSVKHQHGCAGEKHWHHPRQVYFQ